MTIPPKIYVNNAAELIAQYGRPQGHKYRQMSAKKAKQIHYDGCPICEQNLEGIQDSDTVLVKYNRWPFETSGILEFHVVAIINPKP